MIERIVLVKLNRRAAPNRKEIAVYSHAILSRIEGVEDLHVGQAADEQSAARYDLSFVLRFETAKDVELYRRHPDHRSFVDSYLKPRMDEIVAWNSEI